MNQGGKKEPGPSASSVVGWAARGFDPWVEYCLPHRGYFLCTVGVARAAEPVVGAIGVSYTEHRCQLFW